MSVDYKAWIISVGNELLIGRVVNTNASWIARKLFMLGYNVERIIVVPDSVDDVSDEISRALASGAKVAITTGGLGPTYDDVTLEGVARAVGAPLELNQEARSMIEKFYGERGVELTRERLKMAYLPRGAKPIPNPVGAAPGSIISFRNSYIISLPGVPREMEAMFESYVEPLLRSIGPQIYIVECGFTVRRVPESSIAPLVASLARQYARSYIKTHPRGHEIGDPILDIKVVSSGATRIEAETVAREVLSRLRSESERMGGEVSQESCSS